MAIAGKAGRKYPGTLVAARENIKSITPKKSRFKELGFLNKAGIKKPLQGIKPIRATII